MTVVVVAVYMPIDIKPPQTELERIIQNCEKDKILLILGCDANAHHKLCGSKDSNHKGETLHEHPTATNPEVVNQGIEPTFWVGNKATVLDITLPSRELLSSIANWQVMPGDTLSDHRKIQLELVEHNTTIKWCRNIKRTNWQIYDSELCARTGLWFGREETPADIERESTVRYGIMLKSLTQPLKILHPHHPTLPKNGRTLLRIKYNWDFAEVAGGDYCHYGIARTVRNLLKTNPLLASVNTIKLQINIDGLPMFKSSNAQLWPIRGMMANVDQWKLFTNVGGYQRSLLAAGFTLSSILHENISAG